MLEAIGYHHTSKMAVQSYSQDITNQKNIKGFFDILIGYLDIRIVMPRVAKIVQDVLYEMSPQKKYVQSLNFPTTFICHYQWDVLAKFQKKNQSNLLTL